MVKISDLHFDSAVCCSAFPVFKGVMGRVSRVGTHMIAGSR
jgi:hypothetical protein